MAKGLVRTNIEVSPIRYSPVANGWHWRQPWHFLVHTHRWPSFTGGNCSTRYEIWLSSCTQACTVDCRVAATIMLALLNMAIHFPWYWNLRGDVVALVEEADIRRTFQDHRRTQRTLSIDLSIVFNFMLASSLKCLAPWPHVAWLLFCVIKSP